MKNVGRWLITPRAQTGMHVFGFVLFIFLAIPTFVWWKNSVPWLQFLSVYAIIVSHWCGIVAGLASIHAQRAESKEKNEEEEAIPTTSCATCGAGLGNPGVNG